MLIRDTEKRPLIVGVCAPGFPTSFLEGVFPFPGERVFKCSEPALGVSSFGDGDLDLGVLLRGVCAFGDGALDLGVSAFEDGDLDLGDFFPGVGDFLGDAVFIFAGL